MESTKFLMMTVIITLTCISLVLFRRVELLERKNKFLKRDLKDYKKLSVKLSKQAKEISNMLDESIEGYTNTTNMLENYIKSDQKRDRKKITNQN